MYGAATEHEQRDCSNQRMESAMGEQVGRQSVCFQLNTLHFLVIIIEAS